MATEELDKKKVTALSELTTTSDNDLYITGEGGQAPLRKISFGTIAAGILNKLSTWTFNALNTTAKTLTGAINELNSSLPFRGISNTLTSQYPTLYSYITAVGKTRDVYLYDWWNNNMFSDMPTRKSATNCAVTIDYHNGASDKVYGTVLVTYTWTDGSYQQFLGKITQSSSTSITWIELPNRSEINELNSKFSVTSINVAASVGDWQTVFTKTVTEAGTYLISCYLSLNKSLNDTYNNSLDVNGRSQITRTTALNGGGNSNVRIDTISAGGSIGVRYYGNVADANVIGYVYIIKLR